jgi:hypothetical protein
MIQSARCQAMVAKRSVAAAMSLVMANSVRKGRQAQDQYGMA